MGGGEAGGRPARPRRVGATLALAAVAVLVGYAVAFLTRTTLPFVLAVIAAVVAIAMIFFREPASRVRWVARTSGVLAGLAVVTLVAGLLLATSGTAPWAGFALVALTALLAGLSLLLGLGSAVGHLATRAHRA